MAMNAAADLESTASCIDGAAYRNSRAEGEQLGEIGSTQLDDLHSVLASSFL